MPLKRHPCACAGIKFYQQVAVADPDDAAKKYTFDLADSTHCACFNVGTGKDGSPIISWSNLCSLYEMPDGSQWAEHGNLVDAEDLVRALSDTQEPRVFPKFLASVS